MHHLQHSASTPLPLLTLLLQTTPHPAILYVSSVMGVLGFAFAVWSFWRKESREDRLAHEAAQNAKYKKLEDAIGQFVDRDALEKRFGDMEGKHKLVAAEVANQHNTLHEYERKRTELTGEFRSRITTVEDKVHSLETMPGRVTSLETKLDNLVTQIGDLKQGQRDLKNELREDMKGNKGEILQAIRELKPNSLPPH